MQQRIKTIELFYQKVIFQGYGNKYYFSRTPLEENQFRSLLSNCDLKPKVSGHLKKVTCYEEQIYMIILLNIFPKLMESKRLSTTVGTHL